MKATTSNNDGFTLVELMVVVVILGILALIAIPVFGTNYEGEFNNAVRALTQDLMRARTMSLSRKENHSIIIDDDKTYRLRAVSLSDPDKFIDESKIRDVTLPSSAKITGVAPCAAIEGKTCTAENSGEIRFTATSEMLSCLPLATPCVPRLLQSVTIYLQAIKPNGTPAPITKRIVVFSITGHIKVF